MLLSIVIPVYGKPSTLDVCLMSMGTLLLCDDVEVVVVDDGSSSQDAQQIASVVTRVEGNVVLHRLPHRGAAAARNSGIEMTHGRFVWFVDADDSLHGPALDTLLRTLRDLPPECDLLCMGRMINKTSGRYDRRRGACVPDCRRVVCLPSQLRQVSGDPREFVERGVPCELVEQTLDSQLYPRTPSLDHTTLIVSRQLLVDYPDVRYDEKMHLLEDTVFALSVLEKAHVIFSNSSLRPYIHHVVRGRGTNVPTCGQSTTSGAWDSMRSHLFVSDICRFFIFFKDFGKRHADCRQMAALYARYRHVYLRVLAVKGCPWDDIKRFRNVLSPMRNPTNLLDALLFLPFINRLVAFLFRISRRKT